MISVFSFPRSGSTWFANCLNTVEGIKVCIEPVYGLRGHGIEGWLHNRHSSFFDGPGAYRGDYMQPTPSANMQDHMPKLFEDLARSSWGCNGFKEVYCCHKIPLALQGLRAGGADPKVIHLWRGFDGVAASFEKRSFYWWVVQTFEAQKAGSAGTPVEGIYHLLDPKDNLETLFLIWLAATYRDMGDAEEAGGLAVCYDGLKGPDAWVPVYRWLGYPTGTSFAIAGDASERVRITGELQVFRHKHAVQLDCLRDAARGLAETVDHGDRLLGILEA